MVGTETCPDSLTQTCSDEEKNLPMEARALAQLPFPHGTAFSLVSIQLHKSVGKGSDFGSFSPFITADSNLEEGDAGGTPKALATGKSNTYMTLWHHGVRAL